jgi:hypothetical protein
MDCQAPALGVFHGLRQSTGKLILGIDIACLLDGFLEELLPRGVTDPPIADPLSSWIGTPVAFAAAICMAAILAGVIHLYQGLRAAIIITQLSVLFGVLFVVRATTFGV